MAKLALWNVTYEGHERMVIASSAEDAKHAMFYQLRIVEELDVPWDGIDKAEVTEIIEPDRARLKYRLHWHIENNAGNTDIMMDVILYLMQFLGDGDHD